MTAPDPGDPGGTPPAGDDEVARVLCGLRLLRVYGPATAEAVLDECGGAGLTPEQARQVLAQIGTGGWVSGGCPDPT